MKRAELKVGEAYLYSRRAGWSDGYNVERVVVEDVGHWTPGSRFDGWTARELPTPMPGSGVLVTTPTGARAVVQTMHLKAAWEDGLRVIAERTERRERERDERTQAEAQGRAAAEELCGRLQRVLELPERPVGFTWDWHVQRATFHVSRGQMAALVTAVEELVQTCKGLEAKLRAWDGVEDPVTGSGPIEVPK